MGERGSGAEWQTGRLKGEGWGLRVFGATRVHRIAALIGISIPFLPTPSPAPKLDLSEASCPGIPGEHKAAEQPASRTV